MHFCRRISFVALVLMMTTAALMPMPASSMTMTVVSIEEAMMRPIEGDEFGEDDEIGDDLEELLLLPDSGPMMDQDEEEEEDMDSNDIDHG